MLYVVGTPIGNLGDITRRAVEILGAVDRIIAEDTRRTLRLLTHLGIKGKPLQCVEAHTDAARLSRIVELLLEGQNFALVTDAGMPGISDPGARLVSAATSAGVNVQVVPGPSAVTAALALSGLVEGPFYFLGFLPRQGKGRLSAIKRLVNCPDAAVIFESPYRIAATLEELAHHQPTRPAVLCRELTKIYEEVRRGTLLSLAREVGETRGEFVLVLGATRVEELSEAEASEFTDETLMAKLAECQSPRSVLEELGLKGKARRELYSRLLALANQLQEEP